MYNCARKNMDSEASIQPSAEKLIDMKLSLQEALGSDWKEKSVFPSVEAALKEEGAKTLTDGQEVLPSEAQTDLDKFIVEANAVFHQNDSTYHARRITDEQGRQKAFIVGHVGKDTFYQTARYTQIYNDQEGKRIVAWTPDTIGLASEGDQVLRVDKVLQSGKNAHEENDILFIEIAGQKYKANMQVTSNLGNDTITILPEDHQQMGTFLHEVGHLLRGRAISRDPHLEEASSTAHSDFARVSKTGSPVDPEAKLTTYQTRKIKADEERGAWALGVSLIKDAGRKIGLDCASPQAIDTMLKRSEQALTTYDEVPYTFLGHDEAKSVPTFSQERKKGARELLKQVTEGETSYSSLPSFDQKTGENLANNPRKVLEGISNTPKVEPKAVT